MKRRYTRKERYDFALAWRDSGLTQVAFASQHSIPAQTLSTWCRKYVGQRYHRRKNTPTKEAPAEAQPLIIREYTPNPIGLPVHIYGLIAVAFVLIAYILLKP